MSRLSFIWLACLVALICGWPVFAQGPVGVPTEIQPHAQSLFVRALTEAYLGDHEKAVQLLTTVLSEQPDEPAVFAALAESESALGHPAEALFYATQAIEYGPEEPIYYASLARLQSEAGQTDAAISTYSALLELDPRDVNALAELGQIFERSGHFEEALAIYERLITASGGTAPLRLRMEALYNRLGNAAEALRMLELAAELNWKEPMIQLRLGTAYRDAGRADDAARLLERYLALEPGNVEGTLMLAEVFENRGELGRARALRESLTSGSSPEEQVRRAALLYAEAEENPQAAAEARQILEALADDDHADTEVLLMLGDLAFRDKDFALAADVLGRAVEQDPRNQQAWEQAAGSRLYAGNPEGAAELAEEGLILFPGNVALFRVAAYSYADLERPRKGIAMVAQALEILEEENPAAVTDRTRLQSLKGLLHDKLGEHRLADEAFDEALELDENNALVLNNYAYILSERNERLEEALEMAISANGIEGGNAYYLDTLGWVYFKLGRFAEAAGALSQAISADDKFALLYDHLGDIYEAQGRSADAREAWNQALEIEPGNEAVRAKLEGL